MKKGGHFKKNLLAWLTQDLESSIGRKRVAVREQPKKKVLSLFLGHYLNHHSVGFLSLDFMQN